MTRNVFRPRRQHFVFPANALRCFRSEKTTNSRTKKFFFTQRSYEIQPCVFIPSSYADATLDLFFPIQGKNFAAIKTLEGKNFCAEGNKVTMFFEGIVFRFWFFAYPSVEGVAKVGAQAWPTSRVMSRVA